MTSHEINIAITELTALYDNLNRKWLDDPCLTNAYQVSWQEEYWNIYQKLQNVNIESLILVIIANSLNEKVLIRLRNLLNDNIKIYEIRQKEFTNIDFKAVFSMREKYLFADKFALLAQDKKDIQEYSYPTEQERQILLKENQQEKNLLENEKSEYLRSHACLVKDYYLLIYEESKLFCSIIVHYFPVEKENKSTLQSGTYFDMHLVSLIHQECNNVQFENLTEIELYAILNLQPTHAELIIKPNENTRMCYLISKLYEYLKTDKRTQWRTNILKFIGIKEDYYNSKYKEPVSVSSSRKSEDFAQRIDEIFNNIS